MEDIEIEEFNESDLVDFTQNNNLKTFYDKNKENIIATFTCPITAFVPEDAVVVDDGYVYDETAIDDYYKTGYKKSPVTRQPISNNYRSIPIWREIFDVFVSIDPELKDYICEKDYNFDSNKETICNILYSKREHNKLKKFKNYKLFDQADDYIFARTLFKYCVDLNVVKYIIDNCEDLESSCHYGKNISHYAFQYSGGDVLNFIIDKQIGLDQKSDEDLIPCAYGLTNKNINGNINNIKLILDKTGVNFCIFGEDFFNYATENYSCTILKMIIEKYYDLDNTRVDKKSIIKNALRTDNYEYQIFIIEKCLEKDPKFGDVLLDDNGNTLAHYICWKCGTNLEMIKKLPLLGINLEAENVDKWRPIHFICKYGNRETIEYLMGSGLTLDSLCQYEDRDLPCYNLLEINENFGSETRHDLENQFIQFIQIIKLTTETETNSNDNNNNIDISSEFPDISELDHKMADPLFTSTENDDDELNI